LWQAYQQRVAARKAARDARQSREDLVNAVRAGLKWAGIDPATVPALRRYEPGGFYGPHDPPSRSPLLEDGAVERFRQRLVEIVECCRDEPLDLATATLTELFAVYCFIPDMPGVAYYTG
jgi:hypothetical protein